MLEQRIAALTSTLESRQPPAASDNSEHLESALRALSERLDRIPAGNDNASAFAHLEQRVSYLLERLEASDRPAAPPSISDGSRKGCTTSCARSNASTPAWSRSPTATAIADAPQPMDSGIVDLVKRELSDIRFSQSETDRRTQDSLETVHSTLGHVVDRLSTIEGDLRTVRAAPVRRCRPRRRSRCTKRRHARRCRRRPSRRRPDAIPDAALGAAAETGNA